MKSCDTVCPVFDLYKIGNEGKIVTTVIQSMLAAGTVCNVLVVKCLSLSVKFSIDREMHKAPKK